MLEREGPAVLGDGRKEGRRKRMCASPSPHPPGVGWAATYPCSYIAVGHLDMRGAQRTDRQKHTQFVSPGSWK